MDQAWIDSCRAYNAMDEKGRQEYWNQLTADQKAALSKALSEGMPSESVAPAVQAKSGCLKTAAIGCTGMILGALLTVALEVMAVAKGVNVVSDLFRGVSAPSSSASYDFSHCGDLSARQADPGFDSFCRDDERSYRSDQYRKKENPEEFGNPDP